MTQKFVNNLWYYSEICLPGLKKVTKLKSLGQDTNLTPPK